MIDIEQDVFSLLVADIKADYPDAFVTGEYVKALTAFPCISIMESDNSTETSTTDSSLNENHADVMYTIDVYSNKTSGKKSECKAIFRIIDKRLIGLGFKRIALSPIPNMEDATIYRMVGRYRATVSKENVIYNKR